MIIHVLRYIITASDIIEAVEAILVSIVLILCNSGFKNLKLDTLLYCKNQKVIKNLRHDYSCS